MKVIKINSNQNTHVSYPFNRAIDIMKQNKCGGVCKVGEGIVEINAWSEKISNSIKDALNKFKIIFTEEDK